ncbi:MAG: hypothetical protein KF845_15570 [Cyclobacteriaceae bacterium]|nr:hypothetical protein [Cyclobacteriaceae bacterium]
MTTENETCPKCGRNSCDTSCNTENTSLGGITDDHCSEKSLEQTLQEAEAFKEMNAFKKITAVKELETGYEFVYENASKDLQLELTDFLKLDLKCCPTYDYAFIVSAKTRTIQYQRFGSAQVKAELKEYLQIVGLLK